MLWLLLTIWFFSYEPKTEWKNYGSSIATVIGFSITWDREEQLRKNQPAIKLLKKRIARNQLMSEAESEQREELLADFKKTVDEQRVSERKLAKN